MCHSCAGDSWWMQTNIKPNNDQKVEGRKGTKQNWEDRCVIFPYNLILIYISSNSPGHSWSMIDTIWTFLYQQKLIIWSGESHWPRRKYKTNIQSVFQVPVHLPTVDDSESSRPSFYSSSSLEDQLLLITISTTVYTASGRNPCCRRCLQGMEEGAEGRVALNLFVVTIISIRTALSAYVRRCGSFESDLEGGSNEVELRLRLLFLPSTTGALLLYTCCSRQAPS